MKSVDRKLKVFLCHATQDKPVVRELYRRLALEGWIDPWLDEENLLPGQDWEYEIEKALDESDAICVCLSNTSVSKEGYLQRELRFVIDCALEKPEGAIYILPVRLEECQPPRKLRTYQFADYFPPERRDWAYGRLRKSLELRATALGIAPAPQPAAAPVADQPAPAGPARPIQWAKPTAPAASPDRLTLSNGMEFCRIPAGSFLMGSAADDKDAHDDEKPQHRVEIPYDYWLARYPVTNEAYNHYATARRIAHPVEDWEMKQNHPVHFVSLHDAMAYCEWLNKLLKTELPAGLALRLPSEAEWEKAARGSDGRVFPWGNEFNQNKCNALNTVSVFIDSATPVSQYSPQGDSPYGCADMSGNVWEWTHSLWKPYPYRANDGREDEKSSSLRVLRGGSCLVVNAGDTRCACRLVYHLVFLKDVGFRVALAPPFS
ncbi:MAG: SUMF1/EgtB/PvdO family nonheme iron enzyme [Anaerolineales bacterium]